MALVSHRRQPKRDWTAYGVAVAAVILSIVAYVITLRQGTVLAYGDAISHLEISRRVLVSTSPGLAQLGGVWLPLPHVLALPLVWIDSLYYNGFAGSVVSMVAFVVAAVLVYKIAYKLVDNKFAGIIAAAVFGLNANLLYMQATPMTESLLFCLLAAMVYCTQQWADTRKYSYLVGAGASALLATLTRYESWPILACLTVTVVIIAWTQRQPNHKFKLHLRRTQDRLIAFAIAAFAGIAAWLVWNWVIFGDPFNFQGGEYAKPSLWLTSNEPAIGNWWISIKTYWYAMSENVWWPTLVIAGIGLVVLVVVELRGKSKAARVLPVLSFLVLVPFFIVSLYTGQRPLHVEQTTGDLYNVRFGLVMAIPAAILVGYFVGALQRFRLATFVTGLAALGIAGAFLGTSLTNGDVVVLKDATISAGAERTQTQDRAIEFVKANYDSGRVLMETFGNERLAFYAVPSDVLVYEGSYRQWEPALANPDAENIRWIITRCGDDSGTDKVCQATGEEQLRNYELVYSSDMYRVYRHK